MKITRGKSILNSNGTLETDHLTEQALACLRTSLTLSQHKTSHTHDNDFWSYFQDCKVKNNNKTYTPVLQLVCKTDYFNQKSGILHQVMNTGC